jgi:hypothetical protein
MSTNVLLVIDGSFQFKTNVSPNLDFTFNTLVASLTNSGFQVTKANREADPDADFQNFNFATSVANLLDYDVIWMIGDGGLNDTSNPPVMEGSKGPIDTTELNAIAAFMDAGGGVFAVGDHYSLGSTMCGQIPRARLMRSWYGAGDSSKPAELALVPDNFPVFGVGRADTTLINPAGIYPTTDYYGAPTVNPYAYFENQSDKLPQTITPTSSPAHPILRNNGHDVTVYPDHMHEGNALDVVGGWDYTQASPYGDTSKAEFREIAGHREMPQIIAHGPTNAQASYYVGDPGPTVIDSTISGAFHVNTLSAYDGRVAGVGRVVTGSTFHHYLDINLYGASDVDTAALNAFVGGGAEKTQGLQTNTAAWADISAVYANITNWLARPKPAIGLILERSTFSQDEVGATPSFAAAIYVTVDGLKPSQFPGGGVTTLSPSMAQLMAWAPAVSVSGGAPISITPTAVASDDPTLADRLQRFTFTYQVSFTGDAFGYAGNVLLVPVGAQLTTSASPSPLTDQASIELIKSANPYMLDLADGNTNYWLSSDIKVFHVVAGESFLGVPLPNNATRADALTFLRTLVSTITTSQFSALPSTEGGASTLSVAAVTTGAPKNVYNFALARVRLASSGGDANGVQVFFRTFVTQTTAALTYQLDGGGNPTGGYLQTTGASPIDLPGTQAGGTQWLSFPYFSAERVEPPSAQTDPDNAKNVEASVGYKIYGALIDNNLADPYLPLTPSGGAPVPLPTIVMGEHMCVVTEVIYPGAPIVGGSNPATSDKISQRNLAISTVANPGLSASRLAMHTFEIEATPNPITPESPPDELLFAWSKTVLGGAYLTLYIPSWNAQEVVELADTLYARHEIRAIDDHTIELPAGGDRYVPIPRSVGRQNGVLSVQLPLGVKKGQRFDLAVQQITNRARIVPPPAPKLQKVTLAEARRLLESKASGAGPARTRRGRAAQAAPRGVFDLGDGRSLVTDLSVLDASGDYAVVVTHPDPKAVQAAAAQSGRWRVPIGAFQLGIPVSVKEDMLDYYVQLLSITCWRLEHLDRKSPWHPTMARYLDLLIQKVWALGGHPYAVPPTPDGNLPGPQGGGRHGGGDHHDDDDDREVVIVNIFPRGRE